MKDFVGLLPAVYTICILNCAFPDESGQEWYLKEV
jgi:hypothetical protein